MNAPRKKLLAEINVVPYIDVMLVLLVIFMITTPLLTQGVNVKLPEAPAKILSEQNQEPLIISIDRLGNYYLNASDQPSVPISSKDLLIRVSALLQLASQEHNQPRNVYVKGDRDVDYDKVVQLLVILQKTGVNNVGLMTENPPQT